MRVFIVALALGGCIYESGGTGGSGGGGVGGAGGGVGGAGGIGGGNGGVLQVAWNLHDERSDVLITCRQDETVLISVTNLDMFPCTQMAGQMVGIPAGTYTVSIYLLDANRMVENSFDLPGITIRDGMLTDLGVVTFRVPNSIGDLRVTWEVQMGGMQVTCSPSEFAEFSLGGGLYDFNCTSGAASMTSVRAGPYTLSSALKQGMLVEAVGPSYQVNVAPYSVTDGGHIVFQR